RCLLAFRNPSQVILPSAWSETQESSLALTRTTKEWGSGVGDLTATAGIGVGAGLRSATVVGAATGVATVGATVGATVAVAAGGGGDVAPALSGRRLLPRVHTMANTTASATIARSIGRGERRGFSSRFGFSWTSSGN